MAKKLLLFFLLQTACYCYAQNLVDKKITDVSYYPEKVAKANEYIAERCKLDIYYPANKKDCPTIIWLHGGGLTGGNKEAPQALMNKGFIVIAVGYRLSPKANVKDIIEDATAAVAWAFKNVETYNGNRKLIFVSGHSAGAYLGLMLTLNKSYLANYQIDADSIAGLISFSAQAITHFTARKEIGITDTQPLIDKYAPLYFVRASAPSFLLLTGDREMELLGRYEENAYLARMMKLSGHKKTTLYEFQGYGHNMVEPGVPLLIKRVNELTKEIMSIK